jgi:hypothetical protein
MTAQLDLHIRTALEAIVEHARAIAPRELYARDRTPLALQPLCSVPAELIANARAILQAKLDTEVDARIRNGLRLNLSELARGIVCPALPGRGFLSRPARRPLAQRQVREVRGEVLLCPGDLPARDRQRG